MTQPLSLSEDLQEALEEAHLRYGQEKDLTISRKKAGNGFHYINGENAPIKEEKVIERINKLGIPPAWHDVAISKSATTHIQAIGSDDKGRRQYIYHPEWTNVQQQNKFNKMVFFGEVLPELRKKVRADMDIRGLKRDRVVATVVWLLENTFIRVGNEEYAKENQSYGLTTLREKHVEVHGDAVKFEFKGKSGVFHSVDIENPKVAKTIKKCLELPGYELFQYINEEGKKETVDSQDVNNYLKSVTGEEFSAKDFRTWGGSVLAGLTLYKIGPFTTKTDAKKNVTQAVKKVTTHLRNTPTTCRCYYIHPTVIDTYQHKILIPHFDEVYAKRKHQTKLHADEFATWSLLKEHPLEK